MITVTVRWGDNYTDIEFPCTDSELQSKLEQLHPAAPHSDSIFILSVHEPTALSVLEDQFLDLDELNYLAKRMDSFDMNELLQFYAAAQHEGYHEPKDLINLTFNLPCYTVVQNLSSMEAVGKAHYLTIHGAMSREEQDIGTNSPAWYDRLKQILVDEGIYEANRVVEAINSADMNLDKLTALIAYVGRTDAASIVAIAERMGDFVFIPGAADESDVSRYFLDRNSEYTLHPVLEDFFDHQRFGEHLAAQYDGRFIDGGFVCMDDNCTLEEILRPVDEEALTLGGF